MEKKHSKICVIGAGYVGATTAFAIASQKVVSELVLIDLDKNKAEGEAMDIRHGMLFMDNMHIRHGDYADVKDSDIIIITAGVGRKVGESRLDLAAKNIGITETITDNIMQYYNGGILMMVANPVDILTYIVAKRSGLPPHKVIGTGTILDTARFRYTLSRLLHADIKNVHGFIMGEHGDSQFAVWSSTRIAGMPFLDYCKQLNITVDKEQIEREIMQAGATVIQKKGVTNYGIAILVADLCNAILKNKHSIYNVSSMLHNYCGIDDICISVPTIIGLNGVEKHIELNFTEEEFLRLRSSADRMKAFLQTIDK